MKIKRWDRNTGKHIESPEIIENFLDEVEALCKKYGISIGHEDGHGGFLLEAYDDFYIKWLRHASIDTYKLPKDKA